MKIPDRSQPPLPTARPGSVPPDAGPRDEVLLGGASPVPTGGTPAAQPPWSDEQHPPTLLQRLPDGRIQLDGFRWGWQEAPKLEDWKPSYGCATVDPSKVQEVYVLVEPFNPEIVAAHVRLMFEMDPSAPVQGTHGEKDSGFVVSFEARMHQGEKYDPIKGLGKHFRPVYQLGTFTDALQRKTRFWGEPVIRYKLKLTPDQKVQLLRNCIDDALTDQSDRWYNTANNSCFTNTLHQINTVLAPEQRIPQWEINGHVNPLMVDAAAAPLFLQERGLLASPDGVLVQPDATRYPQLQHVDGRLGRLAAAIGSLPGIRPACRIAGGLAGAVAGGMTGGIPGALCGIVAGQWLGRAAGDALLLHGHLTREPSEKYFPASP